MGGVETLALAEAVAEALRQGRPYVNETSALSERGADPHLLADLAPFAESGAPTAAKLLADFGPVAKRLRVLAEPAPRAGRGRRNARRPDIA